MSFRALLAFATLDQGVQWALGRGSMKLGGCWATLANFLSHAPERAESLLFYVAIGVTYAWIVVTCQFWVGLSDTYNPKMGITRIKKGLWRLLFSFEGVHLKHARRSRPTPIAPKGWALRFPHGWLKYPIHMDTPLWLGGPYVVGCTGIKCQAGHPYEYYFDLSRFNHRAWDLG